MDQVFQALIDRSRARMDLRTVKTILGHARLEMAAGRLQRTMIVAKGSLFLGRMTQLWDGLSVLVEHPGNGVR